jgi:hypothetical protein
LKQDVFVQFSNGSLALTAYFGYEKSKKYFFFCIKWSSFVDHFKTEPEIGWLKTIRKPGSSLFKYQKSPVFK